MSTFIKITEDRIKKVVLSALLKRLQADRLDENEYQNLVTRMSCFINQNLHIDILLKYLINPELNTPIMKHDVIKFKLNTGKNTLSEFTAIKDLLNNINFGLTCIKNDSNVFCLTFVHYFTPESSSESCRNKSSASKKSDIKTQRKVISISEIKSSQRLNSVDVV